MTPLCVQESLFSKLHIHWTDLIKLISNSWSPHKLLYFSHSLPLLTLRLGYLWRDPTRWKQLSTVAILGFQFGLYHVVVQPVPRVFSLKKTLGTRLVVVALSFLRSNQPRFNVTRLDYELLFRPHLFRHLRNITVETMIKNRIPTNPPLIIAMILISPFMLPETMFSAL